MDLNDLMLVMLQRPPEGRDGSPFPEHVKLLSAVGSVPSARLLTADSRG